MFKLKPIPIDEPLIISPNLGNPLLISPITKNFDDEVVGFEFSIILIAPEHFSPEETMKICGKSLQIIPLSSDFTKKVPRRALRLSSLPFEIKSIRNIVSSQDPLIESLLSIEAFPESCPYYQLSLSLSIAPSIFDPSKQEILLCDLIFLGKKNSQAYLSGEYEMDYPYPENPETQAPLFVRVNYHSLIFCKHPWEKKQNYKFWQATDLHISAMCDRFPRALYRNLKSQSKLYQSPIDTSSIQEQVEFSQDSLIDIQLYSFFKDPAQFMNLPYELRIQNYNNNLRVLVHEANLALRDSNLLFITLTGDLTDYNYNLDVNNNKTFTTSNFKIFRDIIVGKSENIQEDIYPPEELLVPIFTILGNHDYSAYNYTPFAREHFGVRKEEIKFLVSAEPMNLSKIFLGDVSFIRDYIRNINCELNYIRKIGNLHLIMLDSGKNNYIDMYDMLHRNPSSSGFSNKQIRTLMHYSHEYIQKNDLVILCAHSPLINPPRMDLRASKKELVKFFKEKGIPIPKKYSIDLLKETNLSTFLEDPRIERNFYLRFGVPQYNWTEMINFLVNDWHQEKIVDFYLCGHTHKNLEIRMEQLMKRVPANVRFARSWPFKKLTVPVAIYLGDYSENLDHFGSSLKKSSLILQTGGLGPHSIHEHSNIHVYREFSIINNKITTFGLKNLRKFIPRFFSMEK